MSLLKEFREFAVKGNVVDMAIGVIIGMAFGKIVSSIVADVIMPPIGLLLGGMDFASLAIVLKEGPEPVLMKYGIFINTVIDFLIIAFVLFIAVKGINKFKKKEEAAPAAAPEPSTEEKLLTEIRDILKSK
ncbi:MAG TPA: large-conductance mechanosensitive channel protein MscL [Candidatus Kapabacteria bacterium]|nr:large-conductance mechanosensitive channel protein MscL [Candidatus Kapabacteria bacterium]